MNEQNEIRNHLAEKTAGWSWTSTMTTMKNRIPEIINKSASRSNSNINERLANKNIIPLKNFQNCHNFCTILHAILIFEKYKQ